jgi:hypothetical protein
MFQVLGQDAADNVALLASCRLALETGSATKPSSQNFTFNIPGLTDLIDARNDTNCPSKPQADVLLALPGKTSLFDWCNKYNLSEAICTKLEYVDITGPHALCFVTDKDLKTAANLSLGELADVRDGQERWSKSL